MLDISSVVMSTYDIRARFDASTVRVYQAYSLPIASPALIAQKFVPPFKLSRMTWIKPSFNWMMYRSGYATKAGQEVVLAVDITREGFEWALRHAALSNYQPGFHASHEDWKRGVEEKPVRVQWDPERDWRLQPIAGVRAIQIGLSGEAVERYVNQWVVRIEDVTSVARMVAAAVETGIPPSLLPSASEHPYPLDAATAAAIAHTELLKPLCAGALVAQSPLFAEWHCPTGQAPPASFRLRCPRSCQAPRLLLPPKPGCRRIPEI
jgi:Domain of unknown function (DUF4291)